MNQKNESRYSKSRTSRNPRRIRQAYPGRHRPAPRFAARPEEHPACWLAGKHPSGFSVSGSLSATGGNCRGSPFPRSAFGKYDPSLAVGIDPDTFKTALGASAPATTPTPSRSGPRPRPTPSSPQRQGRRGPPRLLRLGPPGSRRQDLWVASGRGLRPRLQEELPRGVGTEVEKYFDLLQPDLLIPPTAPGREHDPRPLRRQHVIGPPVNHRRARPFSGRSRQKAGCVSTLAAWQTLLLTPIALRPRHFARLVAGYRSPGHRRIAAVLREGPTPTTGRGTCAGWSASPSKPSPPPAWSSPLPLSP